MDPDVPSTIFSVQGAIHKWNGRTDGRGWMCVCWYCIFILLYHLRVVNSKKEEKNPYKVGWLRFYCSFSSVGRTERQEREGGTIRYESTDGDKGSVNYTTRTRYPCVNEAVTSRWLNLFFSSSSSSSTSSFQ